MIAPLLAGFLWAAVTGVALWPRNRRRTSARQIVAETQAPPVEWSDDWVDDEFMGLVAGLNWSAR